MSSGFIKSEVTGDAFCRDCGESFNVHMITVCPRDLAEVAALRAEVESTNADNVELANQVVALRADVARLRPVVDEVLRQSDISYCPLCRVGDHDNDGGERHEDECPVAALAPSAPAGEREGVNDEA